MANEIKLSSRLWTVSAQAVDMITSLSHNNNPPKIWAFPHFARIRHRLDGIFYSSASLTKRIEARNKSRGIAWFIRTFLPTAPKRPSDLQLFSMASKVGIIVKFWYLSTAFILLNKYHPFFLLQSFFFLMALNIKLLGYYPSMHELRIAQNVILRKPFRFSSPLPAWQWLPSWARTRPNGLGTARCPPTQPAPTACQRERRSKRRRRPPCCAKMWVY